MSTAPFKPITREEAAEILSVSLTTLEAMIMSGVLPPPRKLGECRKLYWHPDILYGALHRLLCAEPAPAPCPAPTSTEPTRRNRRRGTRAEAGTDKSDPVASTPAIAGGHRDARTRQAERLEALNR